MSWGDCGLDKNGRPIGYVHEGTCDHPGCNKKINRGLSYACGGMHGEDEISCDKYFCEEHRSNFLENSDSTLHTICDQCYSVLVESGDWKDDDGCLVLKTEF
ncbi:hypothetical protein ZPAH1_orf00357 [Aeromonas phage ZPAH1]|nr:hypothetical protein ASwh1_311 [Aeromonas phage Aswh_1]QQG34119.1 hypothetical protein ZPAH1_orf00357 [Aeromonas phage ZPAH1]